MQSFKTTRPRAAQRVGLRGASPHALVLRGVADGGRWQIACGPSDSERWPNGGPKSALFDGVSAARRRLNGKGNLGGGSVRGTGPSDHLRRTDSEMRRTGMPLKQVLSLKFFYSFSSRPQAPHMPCTTQLLELCFPSPTCPCVSQGGLHKALGTNDPDSLGRWVRLCSRSSSLGDYD